ncbi:kinesin heavy chain-like [Rhopilema esculentum]|uniref:kinesin heavy chain-like n=1 Tax=Rhopilema esculentum TaxID=499914 RepID=UPI0031D14599
MSERKQIQVGKDTGRVKVYVRIRPLNREENATKTQSVLQVSKELSQISVGPDAKTKSDKIFQFDHVFSPDVTNQQVCDQLSKPIVNSALNGFNGTLIAYGQTGTGKTHTLMAADGITHDIIHRVFNSINSDTKHNFKVSASYLQIYQEKIHDLLTNNTRVELCIRENSKSGIYVENLTEYVIRSPAEALALIAFGKRRLVFAETKMNRTSSRSHSVFQLSIEKAPKKEKHTTEENTYKDLRSKKSSTKRTPESVMERMGLDEDVIIKGKIHLCDLAGSERVKKTCASGERLSEAQHINSSLLELGNVIQALADSRKSHVPFRNSVLTRLLQESLGGNCKTSLIVCVSPTLKNIHETKSTLNFGSRAMRVTNTAFVNMEVDFKRLSESLLKKLEQQEHELTELRRSCNKEWQSEKQELVDQVETISSESEAVIKSLKTMYEQQVEHLKRKIADVESEITSKDNCIASLKEELKSARTKEIDEDRIAKLLLLNEMTSLDLLAAAGCGNQLDDVSCKNDWKAVRNALLEHCLVLLQYSSLFLSQGTASNNTMPLFLNAGGDLSVDTAFERKMSGQERIQQLKEVLCQSKIKMDCELSRLFQDHANKKSCDIEGSDAQSSNVLELCKIILEKGHLSRKIAVENQELRMKIASILGETEANKDEVRAKQVENQIRNMEVFAEKLKMAFDVQTDVDDKFSGFEFTLSKIEDILAEKSGKEEKDDAELKSQKQKGITRNDNNTKMETKSLKANSEKTGHSRDSKECRAELPLQGKEARHKQYLERNKGKEHQGTNNATKVEAFSKLIQIKQEDNLMQFIKQEEKENKAPHLENFVSLHKELTNFDLPEEKAFLSNFVSDVKEIENFINECIDVEGEISKVKAELERKKKKDLDVIKYGKKKGRKKGIDALNEFSSFAANGISVNRNLVQRIHNQQIIGHGKSACMTASKKALAVQEPFHMSIISKTQHINELCMPSQLIQGGYYVPSFLFFPVALHPPMHPCCFQCKADALSCCHDCSNYDDWNAAQPAQLCKRLLGAPFDATINNRFAGEYLCSESESNAIENELISKSAAESNKTLQRASDMTSNETDLQTQRQGENRVTGYERDFFLEDNWAGKQQVSSVPGLNQYLGRNVDGFDEHQRAHNSVDSKSLKGENEQLNVLFENEGEPITRVTASYDEHLRELGIQSIESCKCKQAPSWNDCEHGTANALTISKSTDNDSLTSDEELDRKLGYLVDENSTGFVDDCQGKKLDTKSGANLKRTISFEKLLIRDCGLLEVQISTGVTQNQYGDSFLSPLVKDDGDIEYMLEQEKECDVIEPEMEPDDNAENQQGVVVKKSWSLSKWFWWKKGPGYKAPVVSVVIQ